MFESVHGSFAIQKTPAFPGKMICVQKSIDKRSRQDFVIPHKFHCIRHKTAATVIGKILIIPYSQSLGRNFWKIGFKTINSPNSSIKTKTGQKKNSTSRQKTLFPPAEEYGFAGKRDPPDEFISGKSLYKHHDKNNRLNRNRRHFGKKQCPAGQKKQQPIFKLTTA